MSGTDPKAMNSWEEPNKVTTVPISVPAPKDGTLTINVPAMSFTAIEFGG
jgi:alpha-N-arabinofuranosidase